MLIGLEQLIEPRLTALIDESKQFYEARKTVHIGVKQPDLTTPTGLQEARDVRRRYDALFDRDVIESTAKAKSRKVPVRIIQPKDATPQGVYLDIHAGGFYLESAATNDTRNAYLADALSITVVSVDYRLAPENPWPAAPDDCATAAIWLVEQSKQLFGTSRLLIGGASAGATLAMTTLLRLRDQNLIDQFIGTVLQFGAYDLSGQTPGGRLYADEYFIQAYVGKIIDKTQPDISPLYGNMKNLPPALIIVGASDILLEDNFAMAARLSSAGCEVDFRVYPEAVHGFTFHATKMGATAVEDAISWLGQRLEN
jgi:acetyl esterase